MGRLAALSKLHVYQKVIIVFVAMIAPVYLINLWMNMMGLSFIKEDVSNSIKSNVKFYSKQLDDQIVFIRNLQLQFLNDVELQKLSFLGKRIDGFEEMQLVNRVRDRLSTILNSSNYVMNVGVYLKSYGRTISTQHGIVKLPNQEHNLIATYLENQPVSFPYFHNDKLYFIETANNSTIVVYLEVSVNKMKDTLSQLVQYYNDSGAMLADERFHRTITLKIDDEVAVRIQEGILRLPPAKSYDSFLLKVDDRGSYRITYDGINSLGLTLYTYVNENEITGPLKQFNIWFIILSIASIFVIIVFAFSVNWMIHKPLKKLISAFKILETDNLNVSIRPKGGNEFSYLYRSFDRMVEKMRQSIQENYEQKIALQHSELKQLQSQINPHFLYNSFFNIYMISKSGDIDNATLLAQKLGSYYQFITRSGKDEVPLDQEYRHALDYCEIQSIRFSNRIHVEAEPLQEWCKSLMVPRLIIQPVVENAFEHAFEQTYENGARHRNVRLSVAFGGGGEDVLRITVEDNGNALTDESLEALRKQLDDASNAPEKTGLINVCRRIRLKFGPGSGVFVSRGASGGLKADIVIDYLRHGG
ncbi:sensor histidine kinase [Cohnella silvisoli]|uniref:Histidine kinase n=1 Tax=Cohnella silvisoli TaxID=2873699 RepID=A0ABV1L029_9BACL|nr:histidine kinase [Cohnella silvisoli]MCD9024946.1 histidine kinase [Cohnella silvisoli]